MSDTQFVGKIRQLLGGEGTALEGAIDAMGREREEQVLARMAKFADQVVVIVEKLQAVVEYFAADRYDKVAETTRELDRLESEADETKEALNDQLSLGGVYPMHRSDLARMISSVDSIANLAAGAADRFCIHRFTLPKDMNEQLVRLAEVDVKAARALREVVVAMSGDLQLAIKNSRSVDKIESEADDLYASMYRAMFDMDIDFKVFTQLKSILDRLERIADRCDENAERLRHMALEYLEER